MLKEAFSFLTPHQNIKTGKKKKFKFPFTKYRKMMVWVSESASDTHVFRHARKGEFKRLLPSASQVLARSEGFLRSMLLGLQASLPNPVQK